MAAISIVEWQLTKAVSEALSVLADAYSGRAQMPEVKTMLAEVQFGVAEGLT